MDGKSHRPTLVEETLLELTELDKEQRLVPRISPRNWQAFPSVLDTNPALSPVYRCVVHCRRLVAEPSARCLMFSRVNGKGTAGRITDTLPASCRRAALEIAIESMGCTYDASKIPNKLFRWKLSLGTVGYNDHLGRLEVKGKRTISHVKPPYISSPLFIACLLRSKCPCQIMVLETYVYVSPL